MPVRPAEKQITGYPHALFGKSSTSCMLTLCVCACVCVCVCLLEVLKRELMHVHELQGVFFSDFLSQFQQCNLTACQGIVDVPHCWCRTLHDRPNLVSSKRRPLPPSGSLNMPMAMQGSAYILDLAIRVVSPSCNAIAMECQRLVLHLFIQGAKLLRD